MKKVFVSGCYDIIHAGHIQFFEDAKALGDHLTVCFASNDVLKLSKKREAALPDDNKKKIIESLKCVDEVLWSSDLDPVFDFVTHIKRIKPTILAVTEDDRNAEVKRVFCQKEGIELIVLPKTNNLTRVSTTSILSKIKNIYELPLRVDFAGGWLDVPRFSVKGGFVVNCAITPKVSLQSWPYEKGSGLGGSAAYTLLQAKSGIKSEISAGVGWQDPPIISETGICAWRSGKKPVLDTKINPDWLEGKMLIIWTGKDHLAPNITDMKRDYKLIKQAGILARSALFIQNENKRLAALAKAVNMSYKVQLKEGMEKLPDVKTSIAKKYLGAGHGGYALYLFKTKTARDQAHRKNKASKIIEPYIRNHE